MAELLTLARPYAKAAFAYASESNTIEQWSVVLKMLSATVQDEAFSAYLSRPELVPADQVKCFAQILGNQQTQEVSNFLTLLAENDRLKLLPEISVEFDELKSQENKVVDVIIETALPLTSIQEQLLVHALEKHFNSTIQTTIKVKPELIAGVVIRAGDTVIDDSALNKLEKMRNRLLA